VTGRTVGVMGDHVTGEEIAAVMSGALGEKVLYEPVIWAEYASFGFPGAQELANQFQWFSEGTDMFAKEFPIEQTGKPIPPCLTSQAGSTPTGTSFPLTDRRTRGGARLQPAGRPASSALQRVRAGPVPRAGAIVYPGRSRVFSDAFGSLHAGSGAEDRANIPQPGEVRDGVARDKPLRARCPARLQPPEY